MEELTEHVSTKCAKSLDLFQQGYSHNGVAKELDVTSSTAKKYLRQLTDLLGEDACYARSSEQRQEYEVEL